MRTLPAHRAALTLTFIAGCAGLPGLGVEAPPECTFPAGTMVTRVGRTPIEAHGIPNVQLPGGDVPGGIVYVTNDRIRWDGGEPQRMWCAVYDPQTPEGISSGMGPLPEGWAPP